MSLSSPLVSSFVHARGPRPRRLSLALAGAFGSAALAAAGPAWSQAADAVQDTRQPATTAAAPGAAASSATASRAAGPADNTGVALPTVSVHGRSALAANPRSYATRSTGAGTRMPLSPRETPQSLSVIGRQQMDEQNLDTLNEVMRQTPGIVVNRRDERVDFTSRGFSLSQMVDGIPTLAFNNVSAEASMTSMAMYERVEVIRGPAGLLNGVGQPGGSINLVRKRPTKDFTGSLTVGAGNWRRALAQVDVGGSLTASGGVRGRLVASQSGGDTFIDRKQRKDSLAYGIVETDLGARTVLAAGFEYQKNDIDGANFGNIPPYYGNGTRLVVPRSYSFSTPWSVWNMQTRRAFLNLQHDFDNGWQVKAEVAQVKNQRERYSGDLQSTLPTFPINAATQLGVVSLSDNPAEGTNRSADVFATGPFQWLGRTHQAVLGVSVNTLDSEIANNSALNTGTRLDRRPGAVFDLGAIAKPDFRYPRLRQYGETEERALYGAVRLQAADALALVVGSRVTWYENKGYQRSWAGTANGARVDAAPVKEDAVFTPYAGVIYDLTPTLSVYGSFTQIFQPNTSKDVNGEVIEPQRGSNVEFGVKGEHLGGRVTTAAAVYRTKQDHVPVATGTLQPDGSPAFRGERGTVTEGYEFSVAGELLTGWQLQAGYAYGTPVKADGSALSPQLATRTLNLATSYRLPGAWHRVTVGGNLSYQNRTSMDVVSKPALTQGGYTLLGLLARYDVTPQLTLSLNVENVTDKTYVWMSGQSGYMFGTPRSTWLRGSYRF
ncbi:TonB-dependent siderophore receptor [Roseateles amylovorans]|uniref:TonB-dependent siderophore receptor n=1 Tax=Roseateles amylovorans TaxID=2978473 RepID=A0ABY6AWS6_9BURK|nr:TonB-dependent siderophore receptor [Roseateles amylovorans]UXH76219.1 TonB-dependent siderophore receptor [Roseateles amylovorans]